MSDFMSLLRKIVKEEIHKKKMEVIKHREGHYFVCLKTNTLFIDKKETTYEDMTKALVDLMDKFPHVCFNA